MKKLLLFTLLLTSFLFPQLKEMEVKPTTQKGGIPINRDNPDKAAIFFYTQFDDLTFWSNYGIVDIKGDPAGGKYIVIVEPVRQTIEVRRKGFKTEMIKIESLQPKDVLYYEVFPKKEEGITGVAEVGVTFQVAPSDAEIMIDGESFPHNRTKKLSIGKHRVKVQEKNYVTYDEYIEVSTAMTLFQIELKYDIASNMVKIEGGIFKMGSNDELYGNTKPIHSVTVGSFYIGKTEVTQELWESVMGNNPSKLKGDQRPVEQVSWYDVIEFCNRLSEKENLKKAYSGSGDNIICDYNSNGYRLPTEAEWEFAARGGNKSKGYKYSGSNNLDEVGWSLAYDSSGNLHPSGTSKVGTKLANELGVYDMSGNVWEWCWDWYGDYQSGSQTNPSGPSAGYVRVLRGGSWFNSAEDCRVAYRDFSGPDGRDYYDYGFRLARTKN
jgi:sulfatase modifying factor 1